MKSLSLLLIIFLYSVCSFAETYEVCPLGQARTLVMNASERADTSGQDTAIVSFFVRDRGTKSESDTVLWMESSYDGVRTDLRVACNSDSMFIFGLNSGTSPKIFDIKELKTAPFKTLSRQSVRRLKITINDAEINFSTIGLIDVNPFQNGNKFSVLQEVRKNSAYYNVLNNYDMITGQQVNLDPSLSRGTSAVYLTRFDEGQLLKRTSVKGANGPKNVVRIFSNNTLTIEADEPDLGPDYLSGLIFSPKSNRFAIFNSEKLVIWDYSKLPAKIVSILNVGIDGKNLNGRIEGAKVILASEKEIKIISLDTGVVIYSQLPCRQDSDFDRAPWIVPSSESSIIQVQYGFCTNLLTL